MKLALLALEAGLAIPEGAGEAEILSTTDDSRLAGPGVIFYATAEGEAFASKARDAGAWIAASPSQNISGALYCQSPAESMGLAACALASHPSRRLHVTGVTGTNGKTSTVWMMYHLWKHAKIPCALIGTLGLRYAANPLKPESEVIEKTGYTTPRSWQLQEIFARLCGLGIKRVAMEASSEALALGRLSGTEFQTAVFTNLTRDHLDYHGTMEDYFNAKAKLLEMTASRGGRIICFRGPEPEAAAMVDFAVNLTEAANCEVTIVREAEDLGRIAHFQNINATLAVLAAAESSEEEKLFRRAVRALPEVPGRFESIEISSIAPSGSIAVIDYAHSPDALETLLVEARSRFRHVVCVFGCGGNRDPGKRPVMGRIAAARADAVIVTDDNPRREDPASIRREILSGMGELAGKAREIGDRKAAIEAALLWCAAQKEAAIAIVAGKGHEEGQIFADRTLNFSDQAETKAAILRIEDRK